MSVKRFSNERLQYDDGNGALANGYRLFFYAAGSSTKQNTYNSSTGLVANSNPIVLNALGEPAVEIWLTSGQTYKMGLAIPGSDDPPASFVWTEDNIAGINDTSSGGLDEWTASGLTPTYVSATSFTLAGDQTTEFHIGRRIKGTVTAGTSYATITNAVFAALTTVTVTTTGSNPLDSGLSAVSLGVMRAVNTSFPAVVTAGAGVSVSYSNGKPTISTQAINRFVGNVGLTVTMAANAATIALKQADGTDASSTAPITVGFRSPTLTTATVTARNVTAALSTVISSGSTGGTVSAQASRIWVAAIDATALGGAVELAWYQSLSGTTVKGFDEGGVITTTAEGGGGAADSAQTWYSTTARAGVPFTILGYFDSTQATAGTWATSAANIVVNPANRPGLALQSAENHTGALATGTTVIPLDDTIPQITEGDQYLSQALTPSFAGNILDAEAKLVCSPSIADRVAVALYQDATANALSTVWTYGSAANVATLQPINHRLVAGTVSATTLRIRAGCISAGTVTVNGQTAARLMGGVANSFIKVTEISV